MKNEKFSAIWFKKSVIDDVTLEDEDAQGNPILFPNPEIRKMLKLANVNEKDVFFDLGCGWGQNLIIALTEFKVNQAIGFEHNTERSKIVNHRLQRLKKIGIDQSRYKVCEGDFDDLLADKIKGIKISEATVIFYGLTTSKSFLNKMKKRLKNGCRLICYYNCLFPEIMPEKDRIDFPFYVHIFPFKETTSKEKWLSTIIGKKISTLRKGKKPSIKELWDELRHDYDVYGDPNDVDDYEKRLRIFLKK